MTRRDASGRADLRLYVRQDWQRLAPPNPAKQRCPHCQAMREAAMVPGIGLIWAHSPRARQRCEALRARIKAARPLF